MADFTSKFPNLHVHGVARFRDGKFTSTDKDVVKALRESEYATEVVEPDASFDPSGVSVDDVHAYLLGADDAERARVLEAEAAGKARVTISNWEPGD